MNNLISITQQGDTLVVDSRLIAERLGVGHSDWYRNVLLKYQTETEQALGILRFKNGEIKGRGQPKKYCFLTEDQATFLMTLSN
jgi:phage regulator Rha-like protein